MRRITFDIETVGVFTGGLPDFSQLEISVVGIHDTKDDSYSCFTQKEFGALWPILERADVLVGYNSEHFDIPILGKYYAGNLAALKHVDLMKEVRQVLGRRLRLDNLAEATLGKKKSGSGLDAGKWWAAGEVEKVKAYCLDDVALTKELYEYARKNGILKYRDFDGVRDIKLDTSNWEKISKDSPALTHTLPF